MARRYEYIIHGPPLPHAQALIPRKPLHSRRQSQRASNLRSLYRNSASSDQGFDALESSQDARRSTSTTPKLPPTPPTGDEQHTLTRDPLPIREHDKNKLHSRSLTPVQHNTPPTPEHTPPRNAWKAPIRPYLAMKPSMASTRAESFKTARENFSYDHDFGQSNLTLHSAFTHHDAIPELAEADDEQLNQGRDLLKENSLAVHQFSSEDKMTSSQSTLPANEVQFVDQAAKDTPETQFRFEHLKHDSGFVSHAPVDLEGDRQSEAATDIDRPRSVYEQVTMSTTENFPHREKSLRDRLQERRQIPNTESVEAFANVIGWNAGVYSATRPDFEDTSNRWSGNSNPSAVEAYVVESPITPPKRGTLRKVVKNDSLRAVSSLIPDSKRASLQSNSDSSHRLIHKKAKLTNQNRWSTGSNLSRRSWSLNSPSPWPKTEIITVAIIPERESSFQTSASSSRGNSRSMSAGSGQDRSIMPTVSTSTPRRKRALSDSIERTPVNGHSAPVAIRHSSTSAPTSRRSSRIYSDGSEQFSLQRKQAERDLRITLDRMESERLSSSLKQSSLQSNSPTPDSKLVHDLTEEDKLEPTNVQLLRKPSSAGNSIRSGPRYNSVGINDIAPGTKEWAELRPPTVAGTPFSQTSMASASPEIIEAKVVSFFPHHNESLQLIEPNRLSDSHAIRALTNRPLGRSNTAPPMKITTPRTSDHVLEPGTIDSPLRNPRRPPNPPQVEVIPATPIGDLDKQSDLIPGSGSTRSRTGTVIQNRPAMQDRDYSESFIKQLTRNFSTRNAKNPKAEQEIDSKSHPFWRPRAFWDDAEYAQRVRQEQERDRVVEELETAAVTDDEIIQAVTILEEEPLRHSNSITSGPVSLVRKISERKRQRKAVDDHIAQQQALVKQTSYSSLQKFRAGRRLYGMPPMRSISLNVGIGKLRGLQDKVVTARAKRENSKREKKREALRQSIGAEVVSQGDSRFVNDTSTTRMYNPMEEMLENARSQELLGKIQEREVRL